jgi:hypothetical protein
MQSSGRFSRRHFLGGAAAGAAGAGFPGPARADTNADIRTITSRATLNDVRTSDLDGLQWDYSCADDVLSAWIGAPQPCDEVVVDGSIIIRISRQTHQPVGIAVPSASRRSGKWPGALNGAFARAMLEHHGPAALKIWHAR